MRTHFWSAALLFCALSAPSVHAAEFPYRSKYPHLPTISVDELNKTWNDHLVIDVRSKFEFSIIQIKGAVNLPMTSIRFVEDVKAKLKSSPGKTPVFYCNGHTCEKSYEAADLVKKAGIEKLSVLDAGVFDWVNTHPDKGVLLGVSPVDKSKLISAEKFKARWVSYAELSKKLGDEQSVFFDVRDPLQRKKDLRIPGVKQAPVDAFVNVLKEKRFKDKTFYIIDAVNKQNQWLQYYLDAYGYKNYHFLEGGADGVK